jgi:hypothetical protein
MLIEEKLDARVVLESFACASVVTKAQHRLLNRYLASDMPEHWNPHDPVTDLFARYNDPRIGIPLNPPILHASARSGV